jgi:NADH-quinone oxidoreductase subunit G
MRLKPRPNEEVNGHWMCDYGRLNYQWINRTGRIEAPLVRESDRLVPMSWSDTLLRLLEAVRGASGSDIEVRSVVSPFASNEDLGAVRRLADWLGGGQGVYRVETGEKVVLPGFPQLALREARAANVRGADLLGFERVGDETGAGGIGDAAVADVVIVLGDDLKDAPADFGSAASLFVYVGQVLSEAARNAHFVLPSTTFAEMEGTFTNFNNRVQRFWPALQVPGMARPAWQIIGVLISGLRETVAPARPADAFRLLSDIRREFGEVSFEDLGGAGLPLPLAQDATGVRAS